MDKTNSKQCQIVLTTCGSSEQASMIATAVIEQRCAACVNIVPGIKSVYLWQGNVENDEEHLLIIKSTEEQYARLEHCILAVHPYELPEVVAVPVSQGLEAYLQWVTNPEQ